MLRQNAKVTLKVVSSLCMGIGGIGFLTDCQMLYGYGNILGSHLLETN